MNDWEDITNEMIKAVSNIQTKTERQEIIKLAILMYLYKSLESEEVFNDNIETLNNKHNKTKIR